MYKSKLAVSTGVTELEFFFLINIIIIEIQP